MLLGTLKFRAMAKVIVTAILQGDNSLRHTTKKDRLIYSSPRLVAATVSNVSVVSTSASNVGTDTRGGSSTSDKSRGLSNYTISQNQKKGNALQSAVLDGKPAERIWRETSS